jgi:hypothetical protein
MARALIIEDNHETLNTLITSFLEKEIDAIACESIDLARKAIDDNIPFDFVVLDWYFGGDEDSTLSRHLLSKLNKVHFRPVFVYAGTITDYEETPDDQIDFPRNLIKGYSKVVPISDFQQEINRIIDLNYSLQLSIIYRNKIKSTLELVLFELNELENVDIARILTVLIGNEVNVDWSNDLMLNLLHRSLISDQGFIENLKRILIAARAIEHGLNVEDRKKIANRILYFSSGSNVIHNGDIVKILKEDDSIITYGIVVTPDCDLEQKKSVFIELIELRKLDDPQLNLSGPQKDSIKKFNYDSLYFFPSIREDDALNDFVAVLKSKLILREKVAEYNLKYPTATKRLLYPHEYLYGNEDVKMVLICSKSNPYKAEFLQKLHSNNSRVGIPDIKNLF